MSIHNDIRFSWDLYYTYESYKEPSLSKKMFKHSDIQPLILKLKNNKLFNVEKLGCSIEGRDIHLISLGRGKTKVLLWSQMHGDESTATMTLFDIFNFFSSTDGLNDFRNKILDNLTLYFIPMLNPDGAEAFKRRNALDIDLNRDALRLESPESLILKNIRDRINADFGFNLHDQEPWYSTGNSYRSAAISFLAPPYNFQREINHTRQNAMQVIAFLNKILSGFIPGHIAKYSDDYESRAFGDNIQKWGTSTILIESGGWFGDYEKQFVRKLNFIALLSAFKCISEETFKYFNIDDYEQIPFNDKYLFDLVIRNLTINFNNNDYKVDIGINRIEEHTGNKIFFYKSTIEDIGDLSTFYGYEELNCSDMTLESGKIYNKNFNSMEEILKLDFPRLFEKGYTTVVLNRNEITDSHTKLPIIIKTPKVKSFSTSITTQNIPNFIIKSAGKVRYAIINGFIYDLLTGTNSIYNGLIIH